MKFRVCAIYIGVYNEDILYRGPFFVGIRKNDIYWGLSTLSHMNSRESKQFPPPPLQFYVIKEYGVADSEDEIVDEWEVQFGSDFPPLAKEITEPNYGFISPEGEWYPCEHGGHYSLAGEIAVWKYKKLLRGRDAKEALMNDGWLVIAPMGLVLHKLSVITLAQKEALEKLAKVADHLDIVFKSRYIRDFLELVEVIEE